MEPSRQITPCPTPTTKTRLSSSLPSGCSRSLAEARCRRWSNLQRTFTRGGGPIRCPHAAFCHGHVTRRRLYSVPELGLLSVHHDLQAFAGTSSRCAAGHGRGGGL
jgi:hypothetical protein